MEGKPKVIVTLIMTIIPETWIPEGFCLRSRIRVQTLAATLGRDYTRYSLMLTTVC